MAAGFDATAESYDRFMGRWTALWAPALAQGARVGAGACVLDVAAGTGEAALAAAARAGASGRVLATDLSVPMLRAARRHASGGGVGLAAMDGARLAARDESADAVLCLMGLMFMPDPMAALAEFRRVLRPGGRVAVAVWAEPERAPFPGVMVEVLARHLGAHKAALELPFALADEDRLDALFRDAGFEDVAVARQSRAIKFDGFEDFWDPIAAGSRAGAALAALPDEHRAAVQEELRARMAPFATQGWLVMDSEALVATATKVA